MKVKKYMAIALFVVMALALVSTAGVIAAPKAAAELSTPKAIQYQVGKTYTFTPAKYNWVSAGVDPSSIIGTPEHREFSHGAKTVSSIETTADEAIMSATTNGVYLQLTGADPATDLNKLCTVTLKVGYTLEATGDANTRAILNICPSFHTPVSQWVHEEVHGDDAVTIKTVETQTYTFTCTLGDIFGTNLDNGPIFVNMIAEQLQPGAGAATAQAQVSSITVTFD